MPLSLPHLTRLSKRALVVALLFMLAVFGTSLLTSSSRPVSENTTPTFASASFSDVLHNGEAANYKPLNKEQLGQKLVFTHKTTLTNEDLVKENMKELKKVMKKPISEPKVGNLVRAPENSETYQRANATLTVLVRNSEIRKLMSTIKQIEQKFNNKFHYPYVFLNDAKFSDHFKEQIKQIVSGEVFFEQIAPEVWNPPADLDSDRYKQGVQKLQENHISYAGKLSYQNMCRYYSRSFYDHPRMQQFKYYWRFEPGTDYFCDIDYDIFKFMEQNNKKYGFVINIYDSEYSIENLWPTTLKYILKNPQLVHPNGAFEWLTENLQNPEKTEVAQGYSTCHFWSNFEIADMDFYRSEAYRGYVDALEKEGGFYYERWGDAPVHSVGVGLFMDKNDVHWFRDIGYKHQPYINAPNSDKCNTKSFPPGEFTYKHLYDQNCLTNWIKYSMTPEQLDMY